jgi:NAD(P)H-hydrate repair Nnr-like enzyme with NAD(P)H-hydrate dehydratase domain
MANLLLVSGQSIQPKDFAEIFAARPSDGHKGTFGSVGILGGAPGMTGAAADHLVAHSCGPIGLTAGELADAARTIRNQPFIR